MSDTAPSDTLRRATFTSFEESTAQDWAGIMSHMPHSQSLAGENVIVQMQMLAADTGGFPVTRLEHSLQTATRAEEDGRDEEYILCALLHDIGDTLSPMNHPGIAATILQPFVSPANHWMVEQHGMFQGYYFWHHLGGDRDAREQYRGHEFFDYTEEFCAKYDQTAFDSAYVSAPLEHFEPLIRKFLIPEAS